jgi:hypothetical protein
VNFNPVSKRLIVTTRWFSQVLVGGVRKQIKRGKGLGEQFPRCSKSEEKAERNR